jgi:23S rRNA-/tRNA-specific pseudouridylate synthase
MADIGSRILYEDNHLIILNKKCGELVQGDETGDRTLADDVRSYLKDAYHKEGNVYLGIPHRLDRPTSGIVIYTKTEKALVRMNEEFKGGGVKKTYWAVVDRLPEKPEGTLVHYIIRDPRTNKSIAPRWRSRDRRSPSWITGCWPRESGTSCWKCTCTPDGIIRSAPSSPPSESTSKET